MATAVTINEINSDSFSGFPEYTVVVRPFGKTYGFTFHLSATSKEGVENTVKVLGYKGGNATEDFASYSDEKHQILIFKGWHMGLDRSRNVEVDDEDLDFINILFAFRDE
jgi:hypothetical protein